MKSSVLELITYSSNEDFNVQLHRFIDEEYHSEPFNFLKKTKTRYKLLINTPSVFVFQIHKNQITEDNIQIALQKHFKTLNLEEYVVQLFFNPVSETYYGSILKLELLQQYAVLFSSISIVQVIIGPSFIATSNSFNNYPVKAVHHKVDKVDGLYQFESLSSPFEEQTVEVDNTHISCNQLYGFILLTSPNKAFSSTVPKSIFETRNKEFESKKIVLTRFLFPILLANIALGIGATIVHKKNKRFATEYSTKKPILRAYDQIKEEGLLALGEKENTSHFALMLDEIFKEKPKSIKVTSSTAEPHSLTVIGKSKESFSIEITQWISKIEEKKWVQSVTLHELKNQSGEIEFSILIKL